MSRQARSQRRAAIGLVGVAAIGAAFALGARYGADRVRARDDWADGRLLSTAIDSVRANALDSLPSEELIRRAVSGMLHELHDPYAAMLRPDGYRDYRGSLMGESQGLGIGLRQQGQRLSVRRVAAGSPAALAGVRRGDRILSWNGIRADDPTLRLRSDSNRVLGDQTQLVLLRAPTDDSLRVAIRRTSWHAPAITESGLLTDSIGYVRLAAITSRAAAELEASVDLLLRRGAHALVLDLRGNSGGLFEEGVRAAALFLPPNALVASLDGRSGTAPQPFRAAHSRWPTLPLTVLVDAGTASATEVIAAALREHGRTVLIGAPSYGKGVVQRVVRLSRDIALRLTTARWLTPTGRALERRPGPGRTFVGGLRPDVLIADATPRDLSQLPREWKPPTVLRALVAADSVIAAATREQWPVSADVESSIRELLLRQVKARRTVDEIPKAEWVDATTRVATVRLLELHAQSEALLRYSVREDAPLRTAVSLLTPLRSAAATRRVSGGVTVRAH
jgi:carboxyl-terminal processing protease